MILVVMSVVGVGGCAGSSHRIFPDEKSIQECSTRPQHIHDLSGTREYEDKTGSYTITLHEEGQGPYDWEKGWLENQELKEGMWKSCGFRLAMIRKEGLS